MLDSRMLELITVAEQKHQFLLGSRMPLEGWLVMTGRTAVSPLEGKSLVQSKV